MPLMKIKSLIAFAAAACLSVMGAWSASGWIEGRSAEVVRDSLEQEGHSWVAVDTDGLLVKLSGEAPDEATRFRIVTLAGRDVDPDRIVDQMDVRPTEEIAAPDFSIELLRNNEGIFLIGLVPEDMDRSEIVAIIENLMGDGEVSDMLETADYPVPDGWNASIGYAMAVLQDLPRSKISATANQVTVRAISESLKDKRKIESELSRKAPDGLKLVLDISAPRSVISPFTLRLTLNEGIAEFDACSSENEKSRERILTAARQAGFTGKIECAIGLGVPSPTWAEAVETSIGALSDLGAGSLTISDADITLVATDSTDQALFDRVIGELDAALPEVFSLHATLPEKVIIDGSGESQGTPEFVATRSPEGNVQLRGRLPDDRTKEIVGSFARARFGSEEVYLATRDDPELPRNWPIRVLASLEALAELDSGSVVVQPEYVEVKGISGKEDASDTISRLLADKLGESENFDVAIRYDKLLDPTLNIPKPDECVDRLNKIVNAQKIIFEPSSAEIPEASQQTIDQMAEVVKLCDHVTIEIGGHTDSQGREIMNQNLSQQRADAVKSALSARRILTRNLQSKGYGETIPIADNKTEEGREANRRIEFKLIEEAAAGDAEPLDEKGEEAASAQTATTEEDAEATSEQN